jgi:hypothetical protein
MSEENSTMIYWKYINAMAIIVNFDLEERDPEAFLIYFFNIFRLFAQHRDNLKKTYLLS